jgi:hypothetical protein
MLEPARYGEPDPRARVEVAHMIGKRLRYGGVPGDVARVGGRLATVFFFAKILFAGRRFGDDGVFDFFGDVLIAALFVGDFARVLPFFGANFLFAVVEGFFGFFDAAKRDAPFFVFFAGMIAPSDRAVLLTAICGTTTKPTRPQPSRRHRGSGRRPT